MMDVQSLFSMDAIDIDKQEQQTFAVIVDGIKFAYTPKKPVLKQISLHVPRAKIYALLGPNGCGKTTLLNILLGRRRPDAGRVHILGHAITGERVRKLNHFMGFMPQEIALDPALTIRETFHYFSKVNHVSDGAFVEERIKSYLKMLQLKFGDQKVAHLSGGQKRLLSLGVTLIYEPKILLLDEPTVGVDSMIREKIWNHLREICAFKRTSVIITTHYMEEAATSDTVGFIRGGEILAEHSPKVLMSMLGCDTLEEVFYRICIQRSHHSASLTQKQKQRFLKFTKLSSDENGNMVTTDRRTVRDIDDTPVYFYQVNKHEDNDSSSNSSGVESYDAAPKEELVTASKNHRFLRLMSSPEIEIFSRLECAKSRFFCCDHICALLYREWFSYRRNIGVLLMLILIPIIGITLFHAGYGRTPRNIPVAVVNHDTGLTLNQEHMHISNYYFAQLSKSCALHNFEVLEDAIQTVTTGRNVLAIHVSENFSNAFLQRYNQLDQVNRRRSSNVEEMDEDEFSQLIDESSIMTYRDHSRVVTMRYLNLTLLDAFRGMVEDISVKLAVNPTMLSSPIEFKEIIYGDMEPNLQPTFLAGVLIIAQIGMIAMISSLKIVNLRSDGLLERDINQSLSPYEINIAIHIIPIFSVALQTLLVSLWTFYVLELPLKGSFLEVFVLLYLTNLQGLFIGTLISTFSSGPVGAIMGSFFAMVVLFFTSGTLWPIEGMKPRLQRILKANPITLSTQAVRLIASRDWSAFEHPAVALPFLTTSLTSIGFFIVQTLAFAYSVRQK